VTVRVWRRGRVVAAAIGAAAAVAVAGCSGVGGTDTAAIVDGNVITEKEAQEAADQINEAFQLQQPLTTGDTVASLITAPYVIDAASRSGHPQSEAAARQALSAIEDPSDATIELVRANAAFQSLSPQDHEQILKQISEADLTVNPRYGTFDPSRGMVQTTPDWIKESGSGSQSGSTPSPSESQG
jgi:hypothetical protein